MFEPKYSPLLPRRLFVRRMLMVLAFTAAFIGASLGAGTAGYMYFLDLHWDDALLDAAMILTGMGPVHVPQHTPGKLFAAGYALYSGVAFLTMVAVLLAPVAHRFYHKFHLDADET